MTIKTRSRQKKAKHFVQDSTADLWNQADMTLGNTTYHTDEHLPSHKYIHISPPVMKYRKKNWFYRSTLFRPLENHRSCSHIRMEFSLTPLKIIAGSVTPDTHLTGIFSLIVNA